MTKLFKYISKREYAMILCSLIFVVVQVWLDLKMPDYMSVVTTLVETPGSAICCSVRLEAWQQPLSRVILLQRWQQPCP